MSKPIIFTKDEVPLCPNGCGEMNMNNVAPQVVQWHRLAVVEEAFAQCRVCRHQMLVADERGDDYWKPITDKFGHV